MTSFVKWRTSRFASVGVAILIVVIAVAGVVCVTRCAELASSDTDYRTAAGNAEPLPCHKGNSSESPIAACKHAVYLVSADHGTLTKPSVEPVSAASDFARVLADLRLEYPQPLEHLAASPPGDVSSGCFLILRI